MEKSFNSRKLFEKASTYFSDALYNTIVGVRSLMQTGKSLESRVFANSVMCFVIEVINATTYG